MDKAFVEAKFTHEDVNVLNEFAKKVGGSVYLNMVAVEYRSRDAEERALYWANKLGITNVR